MKKFITIFFLIAFAVETNAQVLEWRLVNPTYSNVDPDAGGPATGSVTFTLQIHTVSGSVSNVTGLSTGWSWQSTNAMLPTGSPCGTNSVTQPANITMSTTFATAGFTYNNVDECSGSVNFSNGTETFDRRASGTVDGGTITLTTTWVDVFTVTLWSLASSSPHGGYVVINSGAGGAPGPFSTYAVSDNLANEYVVNSLTFTTALGLESGALPVTFSGFDANCTNNGVMIRWSTATELNSNNFEVERSINGREWKVVGTQRAAGNSSVHRNYTHLDLNGGNALYRIKQTDIDGNFFYTDIVSTNCSGKNIDVTLYPVPAHDKLIVVIKSDRALKTQLLVVDGIGRIVKIIDAPLAVGTNNFTVNVNNFAQGEYLIRSSDKTIDLNRKFSVVR